MANLNNSLEKSLKQEWYTIKDAKDIIVQYIAQNELETDVKRGHIKVDPYMIHMVGNCKPEQNQVKKEYVMKNIMTSLNICYLVTQLDQNLIIRDKERQKFFKGEVPQVEMIATKHQNKKVTTVNGLELFMSDYDEMTSYLKNKCATSVSKSEHKDHTPKSPKYTVIVQGQQLKILEQIFTEKYMIPKKYIKMQDKVGGKKKRS